MAKELLPTGLYRATDVQRETDRAVQVVTGWKGGSHFYGSQPAGTAWFPKSQIEFRTDVYGEQLFAPGWLIADKLGRR